MSVMIMTDGSIKLNLLITSFQFSEFVIERRNNLFYRLRKVTFTHFYRLFKGFDQLYTNS